MPLRTGVNCDGGGQWVAGVVLLDSCDTANGLFGLIEIDDISVSYKYTHSTHH